MSNFTKKTSLSFIVILMVTMLMMSMSYAASFIGADFDLDNIPKSTILHVGQNIILPSEEPVGEYGRWEIISGQTRAKMYQGRMFETLKTGTVKVSYPANSGETYTVSIKITNHKYDKSTDLCSCGARRPVSSMKFSKSSYAFTEDMGTIDMSKYLNVKPASTASNVDWYVNTVSAWYGDRVATINLTSGKLSLKDYGTGRIRAVDYVSGKEVSVPFAVFDKELLSQYTVCLGKTVVLPIAERGARWEIVSGDNKVEELYNGAYEGVKNGTVKLVYSTEVGDFTTKIKVANHKYNKATGLCVCGAKQPPKTMKFNASTFIFDYYDDSEDVANSKYVTIKPEGALADLEWAIETLSSWYANREIATIDDEGTITFNDWGTGKLYATEPESGKEIEANIVIANFDFPTQLQLHVGQAKGLATIERGSEWTISKGDKYVRIDEGGNVEGIKSGTATLTYPTEIGTITMKVKVVNHKYDKTTGKCECGAKQPPKTMKFNSTTFGFDYYDEEVNMLDSKYFTINPEGAKNELEWYFTTVSSWYNNTEVAVIDDEGNLTFNDWGTGILYATHPESGKTVSTKIYVGCGDVPPQIDMHVGKQVYLPVIEPNSKWYISKGSNVVLDGNYTQFVRGTKAGTSTLVYPSAVGDITVKVKVSNHKYDKTTGLCSCGDALPPKVFKFNSTTYEVLGGETDFGTSKYLTISPVNAVTDLSWYVDTISSWYSNQLATVTQDGVLNVEPGVIGIGKLVVKDKNSGKETSTYLIKANKPHQDVYTVHVERGINLPQATETDRWEILSGEEYVVQFGNHYMKGEKEGTVKVRHITEVGYFDATIKVLNHSFDSNGVCSCGKEEVVFDKNITYTLEDYGIMSRYPDGSFRPGVTLNRAEVAKLLALALNLAEDAENMDKETDYLDESLQDDGEYEWARGYINLATEKGIIKGYPDGTFKPEGEVSVAEFSTMVLRVLGYADIVAAEGTWPTNVILKCQELELFDNADYETISDKLTRGFAATVIYNALYTPMWEKTGAGTWEQGITLEEYAFSGKNQFMVLVSNGPYYEEASNKNDFLIDTVNDEGNEDTYIVLGYDLIDLPDFESLEDLDGEYYTYLKEDNSPLFFWANLNTDGEIEELVNVVAGETYGNYEIEEFVTGLDDDNYLDETFKVNSSTVVIKAMPWINSENEIIGVKVEASKGTDALEGFENGLVAYQDENPERASYVFVTKTLSEVMTRYDIIDTLTTLKSGEKIVELLIEDIGEVEVSDDSVTVEEGDFIVYKLSNDIITIIDSIKPTDIDDERIPMITDITDGVLTFSLDEVGAIDTQKQSVIEDYEDTVFMFVDSMRNSDDMVEFCEIFLDGAGIEDVEFYVGDRVIFDEIDGVVIIISGISESDSIKDGVVTER